MQRLVRAMLLAQSRRQTAPLQLGEWGWQLAFWQPWRPATQTRDSAEANSTRACAQAESEACLDWRWIWMCISPSNRGRQVRRHCLDLCGSEYLQHTRRGASASSTRRPPAGTQRLTQSKRIGQLATLPLQQIPVRKVARATLAPYQMEPCAELPTGQGAALCSAQGVALKVVARAGVHRTSASRSTHVSCWQSCAAAQPTAGCLPYLVIAVALLVTQKLTQVVSSHQPLEEAQARHLAPAPHRASALQQLLALAFSEHCWLGETATHALQRLMGQKSRCRFRGNSPDVPEISCQAATTQPACHSTAAETPREA